MERTVSEVMTRDVVTAGTDTPVREVALEMARQTISCVVIVSGRKPIGIISERDIVRIVARQPNMLVGMIAREAMSSPAVSLAADTRLGDALAQMKERGFRRFPIVDAGGNLIGLLTQTDVLRSLSH